MVINFLFKGYNWPKWYLLYSSGYPWRKGGGGNGNVYVGFYCGMYSVDVVVAFFLAENCLVR
jgi:hypothetical protein